MKINPYSIVIAAGGTGGHIYPGIALADAIRRRDPDARVSFVGTSRGLETSLVPGAGYRLHTIGMRPFARPRRYLVPMALGRSTLQCREILRREDTDVAVGMGGYVTAPLIVGARSRGLPSVIHESNAVPGRANSFSARFTSNVALAFDEAGRHLPGARVVGMPLTTRLSGFDRQALRAQARQAYDLDDDTFFLVVTGGSLGATSLNEAAAGLAELWRDRPNIRILIKAGHDRAAALQSRLEMSGADKVAIPVAYIDRMDHAYAAADLMVCRSGSATVAELTHVAMPSILVPYPYAPHDHQTHNARVLERAGAARLIQDAELGPEVLAGIVDDLMARPERLAAMAGAAGDAAVPDAAETLAAWVLDLAEQHRQE